MTSGDEPDATDAPAEPAAAEPYWQVCRRCGLDFTPGLPRCPHCGARYRTGEEIAARTAAKTLNVVLVIYSLLFLTSVIHAAALLANKNGPPDSDTALLATVSIIDAILVLFAAIRCGRMGVAPLLRGDRLTFHWLAAAPVLAILLGLNYLYFHALRTYLGADWLLPDPTPLTTANVLLFCVLPGIVEEFFFRYLALDALRRAASLRAAIFLSSAMFALVHLYNPLGMPYLFVVGLVFALLRATGSGLLLTMVLHAAHNYVVLYSGFFE